MAKFRKSNDFLVYSHPHKETLTFLFLLKVSFTLPNTRKIRQLIIKI